MDTLESARPDPDTLLTKVKAEEQRTQRGSLKIFFGACAGVGKTFAMLEAARAQKASGIDVVLGIVETHGRKETEALLQGLDPLPLRFVDYKNTKLREFDLAAALARRPGLILVDELAHTNAPGCKNQKRWQDVKQLIDAGINVYTTLNVQHLESINDVVAQITGVVVRETIPDAVVEEADEIELIDLPPDDLLLRLKGGKVYVAEQAQHAATHFFRKGNLIALRELALRRTADRVNAQVRSYRQEQSIKRTWPTHERIIVCVGPSPFSARLVRAARRMSAGLGAEWIAVTVEGASLSAADRQCVDQNMRLAEQLGAETVALSGQNVVAELVSYARSRNVTKIIAGKPNRPRWKDRLFGSFVDELLRVSGEIDVHVIKGDPEAEEPRNDFANEAPPQWSSYTWALATVCLCTMAGNLLFKHIDLSNIIMVYLLGVVAISARFGRGPAIFSSIASVAAFDFFFVPPFYTFVVSDAQYLITFAVMLFVGIIISSLTVQIQNYARSALLRERRTAALYAMSRQLASARGTRKLLDIAATHVAEVFDASVVALTPDQDGRLHAEAGNSTLFPMSGRERGVAQWVFDLGRIAGMGTDTLPGAEAIYVPMNATRGPIGVLGVHPNQAGRLLSAEQMHLLETFASQAALAVESDRFADEAQSAKLNADIEKSRATLLSSVSHDLRTPLAAICGAASSLREDESRLDDKAKDELLDSINSEANRLSRLVTNLLEITKLESGAASFNKELCPIEEVIGSAVARLESVLQDHPVKTSLPADLPMIPMDVLLMEQVFLNLFENAAKYTKPGTGIDVNASTDGSSVRIEIADHGPGIAPGDEKRIFEKFYRSNRQANVSGAGLGLAICRAIVEAHGGKIWVENRPGGGAIFRLSLPLGGMSGSTKTDSK